jgi:prolipoprotein diacylglyceryltransferase
MLNLFVGHNPVVYTYVLIVLILLSPWMFYCVYLRQQPNTKIALKDTLSVWLNVILWGSLGSLFASFVESTLLLEAKELSNNLGNGQRLYGGILFVLLYYYYTNAQKKLLIIDVLALITLPLFVVGKIGCLLAGHTGCAGTLSTLSIGFWFENSAQTGYDYLHPKQLYDSLFYILLFCILLIIYTKQKKAGGYVGVVYIFAISAYTLLSSCISNERAVLFSLKTGQFFSCITMFVGVLYFNYRHQYNRSSVLLP